MMVQLELLRCHVYGMKLLQQLITKNIQLLLKGNHPKNSVSTEWLDSFTVQVISTLISSHLPQKLFHQSAIWVETLQTSDDVEIESEKEYVINPLYQ